MKENIENQIYSENTIVFNKIYDNLINTRRSRGLDKSKLDGYYEKHHIVPKCMGGKDEDENYVLLTYKEHILAHKLLYRIYPDVSGNLISLYAMALTTNPNHKREQIPSLSTKYIAQLKEEYIQKIDEISRKQLGKEVSEDVRKKISSANMGKSPDEKTREKLDKLRYKTKVQGPDGKVYESFRVCAREFHISETSIKDYVHNHPEKGFTVVGTSARTSFALKVKGPDGTIYKSIKECARAVGKCDKTISKWIRKYPDLGYSYCN